MDGILGYAPETATEIARNVLVYADTGGKGYPPKPKDEAKDKKEGAKPADAGKPGDKSKKAGQGAAEAEALGCEAVRRH